MRKIANRRVFMATAVAGGSLAAARPVAPRQIIDTHTHFYDPRRPEGVPWPRKDEALLYKPVLPELFCATVAGMGVTGTVVVEASPWVEDNQWLLDLAKHELIIVGVVGNLRPGTPQFASGLERFAKNRLFRGIRLSGNTIASGLGQGEFISDIRRLADAGLSLDAIGSPAMFLHLATLSDRVPELRIVINHLPGSGGGSLRELSARRQICAKVSEVLRRVDGTVRFEHSLYKESLDELWNTFGRDRLIYGSNWPVSDRLSSYEIALNLVREYFAARGADAADAYFWKNAAAVYKWVNRT
jgi:predicted TIM-barrel fold metal-dependent hydrolase